MGRYSGVVKRYLSLVKFSHTIFAMPFAMLGFFMGLSSADSDFSLRIFLLIVLCMIFARNAAMAFNRLADRKFDLLNPRTATREIPAGVISPSAALLFVIINSLLFIVAAGLINRLTLYLSPVALLVILGYSLTKRFTPYSHLFLGLGLALAPVGAFISVTGSFALAPILVGIQVFTWVGSFDIIYSMQDSDFDRENRLFSIPSKFGRRVASIISIALHIISVGAATTCGLVANAGILFYTGTGLFALLLVWEHIVARRGDNKSINMAFATINSYAGVVFVLFALADLYL